MVSQLGGRWGSRLIEGPLVNGFVVKMIKLRQDTSQKDAGSSPDLPTCPLRDRAMDWDWLAISGQTAFQERCGLGTESIILFRKFKYSPVV